MKHHLSPHLPSPAPLRSNLLRAVSSAVCASLLAALVACSGEPAPALFELESSVAAGDYSLGSEAAQGLSLGSEPRIQVFSTDYERRPAVLMNGGRWQWRGILPERTRLQIGAAAVSPGAHRLVARLHDGRSTEVLDVATSSDPERSLWLDVGADLEGSEERIVTLEVELERLDGQPLSEVAWGPVVLRPAGEALRAEASEPPNLLFILVDTLRYDRLSAYGYERPTTPHIDSLLADRGVLLENAYSQAPWTLPSVVSYLTGRYPGEVLSDNMAAFGIPPQIPSLPERVRDRGYVTAGFYANPALYRGNGFDRGFDTVFTPPADLEWFTRHADDLNRRMIPWLEANQHRPFMLYAHYLDPHDPYDNPDIVDDRSQFYPDYPGHLHGRLIHGIYGGYHKLYFPEEDVRHINALYDSEVVYVDRFVGQLVRALEPEVLDNTLIVLTSDHGEELYDHGGWKHGQTLYEEQIHVPLIFRWDRRFPAGQRLRGTVELVDLMPTLMAALGAEPDPLWQGRNLLSALAGEAPLPRRPAFAQHLSSGPLRAASVLDGNKLILFNRQAPFDPPDKLQEYLWRQDLERMETVELYDLGKDPGEQDNRAGADPAAVENLSPVIHRHLDRRLPGLRIVADGLPSGAELEARVRFESSPAGWNPYFLGAEDGAQLTGTDLVLQWRGEAAGAAAAPGRGVRVDESFGRVLAVEATLDGEPLPPAAIQVGGRPYQGGAVAPAELESATWPAPREGVSLRLWLPAHDLLENAPEENEETRRRLKALGYL